MSVLLHPDAWADVALWQPPLVGADEAVAPAVSEEPCESFDPAAAEQVARERGYADGLQAGREAARAELQQSVARLEALLEAMARPLQSLDEATECELARLAALVARRVVAHELRTQPERVVQAVHAAVAALPAATRQLQVYLQPDDLALVRDAGCADAHWELLSDATLARGDCRLESEHSSLDARVETRLASLVDALLGEDSDTGETA
jgi:flagellar assembly protein FliH